MSLGSRKVWIWLTYQQVEALLAVAQTADATPEALEAVLPDRGDRFAFRRAVTGLNDVRAAWKTMR